MPIRFRCAYCNQLMGIARRKSGTVVRCPRCAGEVIVPTDQLPQPANGPGRLKQAFEDEEFEKEFAEIRAVPEEPAIPLGPAPSCSHRPLAESEPSAALPPSPARSEPAMPRSVYRPGLFFTVPVLAGLAAALLLLIGGTFLLGFFLGRWTVR
jgi:hypothetical protein